MESEKGACVAPFLLLRFSDYKSGNSGSNPSDTLRWRGAEGAVHWRELF